MSRPFLFGPSPRVGRVGPTYGARVGRGYAPDAIAGRSRPKMPYSSSPD